MGTNYEWRELACPTCCRSDTIHVGKSSGGWSFLFHGYRHDPDDGVTSPFGFAVESRADWRKVFTERPGTLVDEYGVTVDDPVAWLDGFAPPDRRQQNWEDGHYLHTDRRDQRDAEGFRFTPDDFS
jgi:hypothetical protein